MRTDSCSQQLIDQAKLRLYLIEPPPLEVFGEFSSIRRGMKFNGYHVLVWLGRLEDSHFIDLLLKGLDELAEFDYVDVSWNSWAA